MKLIVDLLNICDYFNFQQAKGKNKTKQDSVKMFKDKNSVTRCHY